jgi:hypothetical protein
MPRKATGTIYESNGRMYAQVTVGHNKRRSFVLRHGIDCDAAEERAMPTSLRNYEMRGAKMLSSSDSTVLRNVN